jgi:hypothetical protein
METETEGGVLDIHFGNQTDFDFSRISLVEKTHLTTLKTQFGHIQWITCLGLTGCMSTTPTAAMDGWVYHLCNLWLKKRPGRLNTDCTASTVLKNQTGTFCYFQDGNGRLPCFTGSF